MTAAASPSVDLVKQLLRTEELPPYDNERLRDTVNEMSYHIEQIKDTISNNKELLGTPYVSSNILYHHSSIARHKRCVLAYLNERCQRIVRYRWEVDEEIPTRILNHCSHQEQEFLVAYDDLLSNYEKSVGIELSKHQTNNQPPQDLFIQVRVLKECEISHRRRGDTGSSMDVTSVEKLRPHSMLFVRRSDAEPLIRTGYLEHVV